MQVLDQEPQPDHIASLEHLTGVARGRSCWMNADVMELSLRAGRPVLSKVAPDAPPGEGAVARLIRDHDSYRIEAVGDEPVWVNREQVTSRILRHRDTIEFGHHGPLSRFRIYRQEEPATLPLSEILGDSVAYMRSSRRPLASRIWRMLVDLTRRLTWQTTFFFRIGVLVALTIIALLFWQQYRLNRELTQNLALNRERMESIAADLVRTESQALHPQDLQSLRAELEQRFVSSAERLAALERKSEATARVIREATPWVAFIQGAYGFRDVASGKALRHVLGPSGRPLLDARGKPLLTLEGDGPVAEIRFTGTGFLLAGTRHIVTNRHVALPWESTAAAAIAAGRLAPFFIRFQAWFPGRTEPVAIVPGATSDSADLAVLTGPDDFHPEGGLKLAATPPDIGSPVVVMGYPTGLRSMLAQAGKAFIEKLQKSGETGFWTVAQRLAEAHHIAPLSSRGIVGQLSEATMVYDAETTHGGSGGPVLNMSGEVVAVNAAILPEYGGSNLGVPAAHIRALLEQAAETAAVTQ